MNRHRGLLLVLLLGCGCPQSTADPKPGDGVTQPADPTPKDPTPKDPTPPVDPVDPIVGPAGPSGPGSRTPSPEDGRPQTGLLSSRTLTLGTVPLQAWIANRRRSRTLGLMHVRSMPEENGMLFVYPDVGRRSFWMRNTYIPLSLAYVRADGTIEQILDMQPLTEVSHPSKTAVKFVLEVNQGWFERHGIAVGTRIKGLDGLRGF